MIVPGCLAVVVKSNAGNEGKIVTVGKYLGKVVGIKGDHHWEVDRPMNITSGGVVYVAREDYLKRIDDLDDNIEIEDVMELEGDACG